MAAHPYQCSGHLHWRKGGREGGREEGGRREEGGGREKGGREGVQGRSGIDSKRIDHLQRRAICLTGERSVQSCSQCI